MVRVRTEALVVRTVEYGESDVIVTLLTESMGKIGVVVRGGRKSSKRVGGALEPFHTMEATLEDKGGDLGVLREARIVRVRQGIVGSLEAMDAAGTALRWARHLFSARTREPDAYAALIELLDQLDQGASPREELSFAALRLLAAVGYALDFERCVVCGKACPDGKPSAIDAARGGLVCRACGGARRMLDAESRAVGRALQRGERVAILAPQAEALLALVDDAMAAHAGYER